MLLVSLCSVSCDRLAACTERSSNAPTVHATETGLAPAVVRRQAHENFFVIRTLPCRLLIILKFNWHFFSLQEAARTQGSLKSVEARMRQPIPRSRDMFPSSKGSGRHRSSAQARGYHPVKPGQDKVEKSKSNYERTRALRQSRDVLPQQGCPVPRFPSPFRKSLVKEGKMIQRGVLKGHLAADALLM